MNGIFSYLKSYVILFLVLTILLEMVPKAGMQKYIRFFSQMILVFGLLYPVLGWMGESDAFLEKIEYQSFLQKMEEVQSDAGWNEMSGGYPKRFAEYNSYTSTGSVSNHLTITEELRNQLNVWSLTTTRASTRELEQ